MSGEMNNTENNLIMSYASESVKHREQYETSK